MFCVRYKHAVHLILANWNKAETTYTFKMKNTTFNLKMRNVVLEMNWNNIIKTEILQQN